MRPRRNGTEVDLAVLAGLVGSPRSADVIVAGKRWDPSVVATSGSVVWGNPPLSAGCSVLATLNWAVHREVNRLRLSPPAGLAVRGCYRLAPRSVRGVLPRRWLLGVLRSGLVLEIGAREAPRAADEVAREAPILPRWSRLTVTSGGAVLVPGAAPDGAAAILRVGLRGGAGDPSRGADAQENMVARNVPHVPRVVGRGDAGAIAWAVEERLSGRRPRRLTRQLLADAAAVLARFPRSAEAPSAHLDDLDTIAAHVPTRNGEITKVRNVVAVLAGLPAVARHGDLWSGNLLVRRSRLSGIVDWDAWHPSSVPGTDLFQLITTERRHAARQPLGHAFHDGSWRHAARELVTLGYWRAIGMRPSTEEVDAIALAWWACEIAGTLRRSPRLAGDRRWLDDNVDLVLGSV